MFLLLLVKTVKIPNHSLSGRTNDEFLDSKQKYMKICVQSKFDFFMLPIILLLTKFFSGSVTCNNRSSAAAHTDHRFESLSALHCKKKPNTNSFVLVTLDIARIFHGKFRTIHATGLIRFSLLSLNFEKSVMTSWNVASALLSIYSNNNNKNYY